MSYLLVYVIVSEDFSWFYTVSCLLVYFDRSACMFIEIVITHFLSVTQCLFIYLIIFDLSDSSFVSKQEFLVSLASVENYSFRMLYFPLRLS